MKIGKSVKSEGYPVTYIRYLPPPWRMAWHTRRRRIAIPVVHHEKEVMLIHQEMNYYPMYVDIFYRPRIWNKDKLWYKLLGEMLDEYWELF